MQAMASAYQRQLSAVSAAHDGWSVCAEQGSGGTGWGGGGVVGQSQGGQAVPAAHAGQAQPVTGTPAPPSPAPALPPAPVGLPELDGISVVVLTELAVPPPPLAVPPPATPPLAQSQLHGGQVSPAAQTGQAQAQVPVIGPQLPPPPVLPPVPPPPPLVQSHLHGGQVSPGAQVGQAQTQVPPPVLPPPEPEAPPPEQSHSNGGQLALAGQASGCTQAHPPPEASRAWQKPPAPQSLPIGHRIPSADQAQLALAWQVARSVMALHGSAFWQTPEGQLAPAGQTAPSATQLQPFWVSPLHSSAAVCDEQLSATTAAIRLSLIFPHPASAKTMVAAVQTSIRFISGPPAREPSQEAGQANDRGVPGSSPAAGSKF
jgi:hypothetical protein